MKMMFKFRKYIKVFNNNEQQCENPKTHIGGT